jgi:hypothetical protein
MLKLCFDLALSMFSDGYSPHTRHGEEPFGHRADDTSSFVVYLGVIFCECGQVELFLLSFFFSFGLFYVSSMYYFVFVLQEELNYF